MRRILRSKLLNTFFALFLTVCLMLPVMAASAASVAAPPDSSSPGAVVNAPANRSAIGSLENVEPYALPPTSTVLPIGIGQTINGTLSTTDPRETKYTDRYSDAYAFTGTQGQQIFITMTSSAFRPYIDLYKVDSTTSMSTVLESGEPTTTLPYTARLPFSSGYVTLPSSGVYVITALSWFGDQTGSYSITLQQATTGTVATPTFSPVAGTYTSAQTVTISTATSGATIRYTTNGTEPTATSTVYTAPLTISSTTTLKAKAFKSGMTDSATATALYTISVPTVATPTFNPAAGTYTSAQTVTISTATTGATIRYTMNGTEPTATSTVYTAPLTISSTTTLKAKAFKTGMTNSATATAVYTISPPVGTMYDVQIYASAGGTVSPIGLRQVAAGGSLALTITPNTGYVVQSVNVTSVMENVNGSQNSLSEPLAALADVYTLNNIQTDKVVSVLFQPLTYSVSGKITANSLTGAALSGATVTVGGKSATTAADGTYKVSGVPSGSQTMTVSKAGYVTKSQTVAVTKSLTNINAFLVPSTATYSVSGKITSVSLTGAVLPAATVRLKSGTTVVKSTTTGTTGLYTLTAVPAGTYTLEVSKTGYVTKTQSITVSGNLVNINQFLVVQPTTVAVKDLGSGVVQNLAAFNGKKIYHLISAQPTTKPEGYGSPTTTYDYSLTSTAGTAAMTGNKITLSDGSFTFAPGVYKQGQLRSDERMRTEENRVLASRAQQYNKALQGPIKSAPKPISVGSVWNNVNILNTSDQWTTINTTCRYVSNYAYFFVDNRNVTAMNAYMADYGAAFDAIYAKNLTKLGGVNDVDANGKVIIVFSQELTGGLLGYFYSIDKYPTTTYAKSNVGDIFYITADAGYQGAVVKGTLAHELQHMIYFDQHYNRGVTNTQAWLNEALSQAAEYYNGYVNNHHAWIRSYLQGGWQGLSLTHWTSGNYGYGAIYIRYLIDQYGDTAIKNMCSTANVGVRAVELATGQDFNTIFENFTRAMVMSGTGDSTDPRYRFTTLNLQTVQSTGRGGLLTTAVYNAGNSVSGGLYPYRIFFGQWNGTFGTMNLTGANFKGAAFGLSR